MFTSPDFVSTNRVMAFYRCFLQCIFITMLSSSLQQFAVFSLSLNRSMIIFEQFRDDIMHVFYIDECRRRLGRKGSQSFRQVFLIRYPETRCKGYESWVDALQEHLNKLRLNGKTPTFNTCYLVCAAQFHTDALRLSSGRKVVVHTFARAISLFLPSLGYIAK